MKFTKSFHGIWSLFNIMIFGIKEKCVILSQILYCWLLLHICLCYLWKNSCDSHHFYCVVLWWRWPDMKCLPAEGSVTRWSWPMVGVFVIGLGFVSFWHYLICVLHCCIRSISSHIHTLKALIDALRGNVTAAANKLFTNKLLSLVEIVWQVRTMFEKYICQRNRSLS